MMQKKSDACSVMLMYSFFFVFCMSSFLLLLRNSLNNNGIGDAGIKAVQDAVKDNTFTTKMCPSTTPRKMDLMNR